MGGLEIKKTKNVILHPKFSIQWVEKEKKTTWTILLSFVASKIQRLASQG
jgi:hypothetical protein